MGILCKCELTDCHYYVAHSSGEGPSNCDCQHTDKQYYLKNPCPLYKRHIPQDELKKMRERFRRNR